MWSPISSRISFALPFGEMLSIAPKEIEFQTTKHVLIKLTVVDDLTTRFGIPVEEPFQVFDRSWDVGYLDFDISYTTSYRQLRASLVKWNTASTSFSTRSKRLCVRMM